MKDKTFEKKTGIAKSAAFEKKQLGTHTLNCGYLCSHACGYCYVQETSKFQKSISQEHFGCEPHEALIKGQSLVDPTLPDRMTKRKLGNLKKTDLVVFSTTTDPYSPLSVEQNIPRRCLERLLDNSVCRVRIITKSANVRDDFDLIRQFGDRLMLGLSVSAPRSKSEIIRTLEPKSSSIEERLAVLEEANGLGIKTFGMLCPCIPGIATDEQDFREMLESILVCNPETIWTEPLNVRGKSHQYCVEFLKQAGYLDVVNQIEQAKQLKKKQLEFDFVEMTTRVAGEMNCKDRLKILIYGNGEGFVGDGSCAIWLRKKPATTQNNQKKTSKSKKKAGV